MRLTALTWLCWSLLASGVSAQSAGPWVVVPASTASETSDVESLAARARDALVDAGANVRPLASAAERFESEASAPATALSDEDLQQWLALSNGAVDDLAEGELEKALGKLEGAQTRSRAAIEELNRDPQRARKVFDTCLYTVRAVLATESESRARSVARECRQLVPRAEPSPYMHPPAVTELLSQIDALQSRQTGALRVESTPSQCPARLNGVLLGETPVSIDDLFPGTYRVQVECDPTERGRVHFVTIGAGRIERRVDARFDEAIESRPVLHLRYDDRPDSTARRWADADRVGREVGSRTVVVASETGADALLLERMERVEEGSRVVATAAIPSGADGPSDADWRRAAETLIASRCTDFTGSSPVTRPCPGAEPVAAAPADDWPEGRRPRGQFIAGLSLVGFGIASLGTGYALLIPRRNAGVDWVAGVEADIEAGGSTGSATSSQQRWFDLGTGILISASAGSAALITAMPLALPERDKTPWWGWVAGAGGLGLAAFSIAWGVTAEAEPGVGCETAELTSEQVRACFDRGEQVSLAVLTGLTAAPLLTMPMVYWFRPSRAKLEPQVQVGPGRAYFGLRGRF